MTAPIMELKSVNRVFAQRRSSVQVLFDVSLDINHQESICLVGESGCGKTTTGKIIAGLSKPTSGQVLFEGQDIHRMDRQQYLAYRRSVQIIHQDPYASLNPVHTVYRMLSFPLFAHGLVRSAEEARARVLELLTLVDLTPALDIIDKFPHELSGGQRQRVSIARALTVNPRLIVADEAVSMVDVSIRISLLNTLTDLQNRLGLTFVFITHDLAVARYFAWQGRIAVMYLGRIVEEGPAQQVTSTPQHPYTKALVAALPEPDPDITRNKQRVQLRSEDIPSLQRLPEGCPFHPRCPAQYYVPGLCDRFRPELAPTAIQTQAACHVTAETSKHAEALMRQAQTV